MSIQGTTGCNKKTVLFDNQNALDRKGDMPTAMMHKLTTKSNNQGNPFKHKINQGKGRSKRSNNYYHRGRQKSRKSQVMENNSEDHLAEVDLSMDKISEEETSGEDTSDEEVIL